MRSIWGVNSALRTTSCSWCWVCVKEEIRMTGQVAQYSCISKSHSLQRYLVPIPTVLHPPHWNFLSLFLTSDNWCFGLRLDLNQTHLTLNLTQTNSKWIIYEQTWALSSIYLKKWVYLSLSFEPSSSDRLPSQGSQRRQQAAMQIFMRFPPGSSDYFFILDCRPSTPTYFLHFKLCFSSHIIAISFISHCFSSYIIAISSIPSVTFVCGRLGDFETVTCSTPGLPFVCKNSCFLLFCFT